MNKNIKIQKFVERTKNKKQMNKKQIEFKKNRLKQAINFKDRKEGVVKVYSNNTYLHELTKFQITYKLKKLRYDVYSEGRIKGGRADIIAISPEAKGYVIEVLNSEKEISFTNKLNKYDLEFEIIKVNCKNFKIDEFEI